MMLAQTRYTHNYQQWVHMKCIGVKGSLCNTSLLYAMCVYDQLTVKLSLVWVLLIFRPVSQLKSQVPSIVKAVHRLLREKSIKTRQCCFSLLSELVQVLQGALSDHIALVIPGIQFSLG